jgi:hypothetical protein
MKLIFTFPPPRLRRTIIPLKNPKNLSEQTGPPQNSDACVAHGETQQAACRADIGE